MSTAYELVGEICVPAAELWRVLTTAQELGVWLVPGAQLGECAGAAFRFAFARDAAHGAIVDFGNDRSLVLQYVVRGVDTRLAFELEGVAQGRTRLSLSHTGLPDIAPGAEGLSVLGQELACRWAFRLEALRAYAEQHTCLRALVVDDCLHSGLIELGQRVRALPADAYELQLAQIEACVDEHLIGAVPGERIVTMRILDVAAVPTVIGRSFVRDGTCTRVAIQQRGFATTAPFWDALEQAVRFPALGLARGEELRRLQTLADELTAEAERCGILLEQRICAEPSALLALVTDPGMVGLWLPGWHEGTAVVGGEVVWRSFEDEPVSDLDTATTTRWCTLAATVAECNDGEVVLAVSLPEDEVEFVALRAQDSGDGNSVVVARLSSARGDVSVVQARWQARLHRLALACAGAIEWVVDIAAPLDLVRGALTDSQAMSRWLHPSAEGVLTTGTLIKPPSPFLDGVVEVAESTESGVSLRWPWSEVCDRGARAHFDLERRGALSTRCTVVVSPESPTNQGELRARLQAATVELERWRMYLGQLAAFCECGFDAVGGVAFGAPSFGYRMGAQRASFQTLILAPARDVYKAVLDGHRPLVGLPLADEVVEFNPYAGGRWLYTWGQGAFTRMKPYREVEHTYLALGSDEGQGPTVVRWLFVPELDGAATRLVLCERGFGCDQAWDLRRVRQARSWRFVLHELRARCEWNGTLRGPGVVEAIAEGEVYVAVKIEAPPESVFGLVATVAGLKSWLADEVELEAHAGGSLRLQGCTAPLPNSLVGKVMRAVPGQSVSFLHPCAVSGATMSLGFFVEPRGSGCRVQVVQRGFALEHAAVRDEHARCGGRDGWASALKRLAAVAGHAVS